jgi:chitinase
MNQINPALLLTSAVVWQPQMFGRLQTCFDQINFMTYDLSGPWPGYCTWFNGPIYASDSDRMAGGDPYPSVERSVTSLVNAGVPRSKIGIGIAFFGYVWFGATGPRQSINGATVISPDYHKIMDTYYQPNFYHWDDVAEAPYLSIPGAGGKGNLFISYDDERLCMEKVIYAKQQSLGGVMIWELGAGYRDSQPDGLKDSLLQAVKQACK